MAFNQIAADSVCALLEGGKSLRAACVELELNPSTILLWTKANPEFNEQYTRAREIGYLLRADEIVTIADTPLIGVETKIKPDGTRETTEGDMLGHRKLQIDTRKWMLSKMLPKIYGDKLELTGDKENPIQTVTRIELVAMRPNADRAS